MKKKYLFYLNYIIFIFLINLNEYNCLKKNFNKDNKLKFNNKNKNLRQVYENIKNNNNIIEINRIKRCFFVLFLSLITVLIIYLIIENSLDLANISRFELNRFNEKISEEKIIKIKNILNNPYFNNNKELKKEKKENN